VVYSLFVFPYLPKELGGGYRPLVQLVLSDSSNIPWNSESIKASADGKMIGPVRLIFENQSEVIVASSDLRGLPPRNMPAGQPIDVVIDRKMLSAILYIAMPVDSSYLMRLIYAVDAA